MGVGAVLLAEQGDTSFKNVDDVQAMLSLPALATLPESEVLRSIARREKRSRLDGIEYKGGEAAILRHMRRETPISFEFRRLCRRPQMASRESFSVTIL